MNETALVVEDDRSVRDQISAWLEEIGLEVMACPGPSAPDYICVAGRGDLCPLARAADIVVLDSYLAPDALLRGMPTWQLLDYYVNRGLPVVVIARGDGGLSDVAGATATVSLPLSRREFLATVTSLLLDSSRSISES